MLHSSFLTCLVASSNLWFAEFRFDSSDIRATKLNDRPTDRHGPHIGQGELDRVQDLSYCN
jgi:hypothetical protein